MKTSRGNLVFSAILVFAAVVFGMVIAGGSRVTPAGFSAPPLPQEVVTNHGTGATGGATAVATAALPNFADLAEAVLPAVASIRATTIRRGDRRRSPLEFFFDPRGREPRGQEPREFRSDGAGSGFVISSDGWIVTNNHVIANATTVEVTLEGKRYEAEIKGKDVLTDLALLKVEGSFKFLKLGDSSQLRVGEWVMAIGNPHLLAQSVTVGVVSAKGRSLGLQEDGAFENYIQTDAAINRGNSGGPLVNLSGEVVGINTAMNFGAENIGFAVPVNTLTGIVDQLRNEGRVRRGYLGVHIENLSEEAAQSFGLDSTRGALVIRVVDGQPADLAGLRREDIIVRVDAQEVTDTRSLIDYVAGKPPGSSVVVHLIRKGRDLETKLTLGEREQEPSVAGIDAEEPGQLEWLGLEYQTLTPGLKQAHEIPTEVRGVWVRDIAARSPLVDERLAPGDIITEVGGEAVTDRDSFEAMVGAAESGSFLRFYVRRFSERGDNGFFAFVRVP